MQLRDVVSAGTFDIVTETGSIKLDDCDASQITAQVETGSITGTLRSSKRFEAKVETGSVHVPKDTDGGLCKLKTETGEIRIGIDDCSLEKEKHFWLSFITASYFLFH